MSMRDWLIIVVIVGIVLILVDGYRRKRRNTIRMKLDKNIPRVDLNEADDAGAELPNGGARVISRRGGAAFDTDEEYEDDREDQEQDDYRDYQEPYADQDDYDDQDAEPFEENVPVLMDAVELGERKPSPAGQASVDLDDDESWKDESWEEESWEEDTEPTDDDTDTGTGEEDNADDGDYASHDYDEDEELSRVRVSHRHEQERSGRAATHAGSRTGRIEPSMGRFDEFSDEELDNRPAHVKPAKSVAKSEVKSEAKSEVKPGKGSKQKAGGRNPLEQIQAELFSESPENFYAEDESADEQYAGPEEVIVINVMAKQGELFAGAELLPVLLQQGMQLGSMSIFHRHADAGGNGPVMFSMANMVKPGTFDVTQMEHFTTPGVSFFLQLPNSLGSMKCFELMLNAANAVKQTLNGDLKDEHRSVITRQTIEHCRQRIQDFELTQLAKK